MASIQGIYVALFGRPADPNGLAYFDQQTNHGANLSAISNLSGSDEYQSRFKGMNPTEIVTAIYGSLLGREPEAIGLDFWVGKLADKAFSINTIAIAVLDAAVGSDKATVDAKIAIADAFTKSLDTPEKIAAYVGIDATKQIQTYLAGVTGDHPGSISDLANIISNLTHPATGGDSGDSGPQPLNIVLTTADDHAVGAATNDTISGKVSNDPSLNTYGPNDTIDGGAGIDTLKLVLDGMTPVIDGTKISNVEKIAITNPSHGGTGYVVDVTSVEGLTDIINEGTSSDAGVQFIVAKPTQLTIHNTAGYTTISTDLSGTADDLSIALDHAGTEEQSAAVTTPMSQTGVYESITINSTGSATNYLDLDDVASKLVITGSGDLSLGTAAATIDASTLSGHFNLSTNDTDHTLTLGSGSGEVGLGAGSDTIVLGKMGVNAQAGAYSISTGDGNDTVGFGGSNDTTSAATTGISSLSKVMDFAIASDRIAISANDADFHTQASAGAAVISGLSKGATAAGLNSGDSIGVIAVNDDSGAVAADGNVSLIKLIEHARGNSIEAIFENLLAASSVTGLAAHANYLVSYNDSANDLTVLAVVNTGMDTTLSADDIGISGVSLIGSISMERSDYLSHFDASSFAAAI